MKKTPLEKLIRDKNESDEQREDRIKKEQAQEVIATMAKNISSLADSVTALLNGELNRKALIILLANSSGLPQRTVSSVLDALESLKEDWTN